MQATLERIASRALGSHYVNCYVANLSILLQLSELRPQWLFGGLIDDVTLLEPKYADRQMYLAEYLERLLGDCDGYWTDYTAKGPEALAADARAHPGRALLVSLPLVAVRYRNDIGISALADAELDTRHSFFVVRDGSRLHLMDAVQGSDCPFVLEPDSRLDGFAFPLRGYVLDDRALVSDLNARRSQINEGILEVLEHTRRRADAIIEAKARLLDRAAEQEPGLHLFTCNHLGYVNTHRWFVLRDPEGTRVLDLRDPQPVADLLEAIDQVGRQVSVQLLRSYLTGASRRAQLRPLLDQLCGLEHELHGIFPWEEHAGKFV